MENRPPVKIALIAGIAFLAAALVAGAYLFTKKFLKDRASLMNPSPATFSKRVLPTRTVRTERTYTAKELEDARRSGQPLKNPHSPYMPTNPANDDAVQRSMRTLNEINRINEMNQRLLDEQQRQQRR